RVTLCGRFDPPIGSKSACEHVVRPILSATKLYRGEAVGCDSRLRYSSGSNSLIHLRCRSIWRSIAIEFRLVNSSSVSSGSSPVGYSEAIWHKTQRQCDCSTCTYDDSITVLTHDSPPINVG